MLAAVIPARNEEQSIGLVLQHLFDVPVELAIPVLNGSSDGTGKILSAIRDLRLHPVTFKESLGIDLPRAIGAYEACRLGAQMVLFVDGDMSGNFVSNLRELAISVGRDGVDLALANCYPEYSNHILSDLARLLVDIRLQLNHQLGQADILGSACPSHGPHCISRRLLEAVPLEYLAIPPLMLAAAVRSGLTVKVVTELPDHLLESSTRDQLHCRRIAETVIGDCLEAIQDFRQQPRLREQNGIQFSGYHQERRFDLLKQYVNDTQATHD